MKKEIICLLCGEVVTEEDTHKRVPVPQPWHQNVHIECEIRSVIGSVGHQKGKCFCFGGSEEDPPGMTKRQAAQAATDFFYAKNREET